MIGDDNGNLHFLKVCNEFKGRYFRKLLTEFIYESKITSLACDLRETFIFIGF